MAKTTNLHPLTARFGFPAATSITVRAWGQPGLRHLILAICNSQQQPSKASNSILPRGSGWLSSSTWCMRDKIPFQAVYNFDHGFSRLCSSISITFPRSPASPAGASLLRWSVCAVSRCLMLPMSFNVLSGVVERGDRIKCRRFMLHLRSYRIVVVSWGA